MQKMKGAQETVNLVKNGPPMLNCFNSFLKAYAFVSTRWAISCSHLDILRSLKCLAEERKTKPKKFMRKGVKLPLKSVMLEYV